jgi:hypothetical protein
VEVRRRTAADNSTTHYELVLLLRVPDAGASRHAVGCMTMQSATRQNAALELPPQMAPLLLLLPPPMQLTVKR